jgi:hypothetical protein
MAQRLLRTPETVRYGRFRLVFTQFRGCFNFFFFFFEWKTFGVPTNVASFGVCKNRFILSWIALHWVEKSKRCMVCYVSILTGRPTQWVSCGQRFVSKNAFGTILCRLDGQTRVSVQSFFFHTCVFRYEMRSDLPPKTVLVIVLDNQRCAKLLGDVGRP